MDLLVRATYRVRQFAQRGLGAGVAAGLAYELLGLAAGPPVGLTLGTGTAMALYGATLVRSIRKRSSGSRPHDDALGDFELGALGAVGTYAVLVACPGGLSGPLHAVVYLFVALAATFARPGAAAGVTGLMIALEGSLRYFAYEERGAFELFAHAALVATFAVLNLVLLRAEITRMRGRWRAKIETEIARMQEAARSYRLFGAPSDRTEGGPSTLAVDDRIARSSVEEIHQAVLFALELVRRSLGLHTAVLVWLNATGTHARISELSTDADGVNDGPFLAGDGIIGAVLARRAAVLVEHLKPSYKLPYYAGPCPAHAALAVPVLEHGHVRGVLIVDRVSDEAFEPREQELVESAARYVARAIQNERLFVQLERAKAEQGKLYRAAQALGSALTEADVVEAGVRSAREVAAFDFAAVTLFDEKTKMHTVRAVSGAGMEALVGARFSDNTGLCAMVVSNRHPLPYKGEIDPAHQVLFAKGIEPPAMPSVLVLPLLVHDRALGTLVLGSKHKGAFSDAARPTLEVLASHMAVSLANARMVKKLEELATTDGLTGLLNKRTMLDLAVQKVAAATRFGRHLSVLVTDIDFFKKVNDTYGHDVGDIVIRGLGEILKRAKRTTDAVARFGGEEFVVVCEETDAEGAMLLAERIRKELESTAFRTPQGPIKVTGSIGIATFPHAGRDWEALFKSADEALYASKHGGRNRSTAWKPATTKRVSAA